MAIGNLIYILFLAVSVASLQLLNISWEMPEKAYGDVNSKHCDEILKCDENIINGESSTLVTFFTSPMRVRVDGLKSLMERAGSKLVKSICVEKDIAVPEREAEFYTIRLRLGSREVNYSLL